MFTPLPAAGGAAAWMVALAAKGALVLLVVLLAVLAQRRASAGVRHLVWSGGIVAVLLLPVVSLALPWRLAVVPVPRSMAPVGAVVSEEDYRVQQRMGASAEAAAVAAARGDHSAPRVPGNAPLRWLLVVWGAGAVFFLGRLGLGAMVMRRVVRRARRLDAPDWTHPLMEGADRLALERLPRLLSSDGVAMPVVCGVVDPAIVVPAAAQEWSDRRRRAVLCHEMAHLRRRDLPVNLLGRLACALHWFNPLAWLAARGLRVESERACDDLVLGVGTRPSEYADHLLQIVCGARRGLAPAVAIPMAQRREFEGRMLAILEKDGRRGAPTRRLSTVVAGLGVLLLLPIAAMAPAPAAAPHAEADRRELRPPTGARVPEPNTRVTGVLLEALEAANMEQRVAAATALGSFAARRGTLPLASHLLHDDAPPVRNAAAWALAQIRDSDGLEALCAAALRDTDVEVRVMAVWALAQFADASVVPKLERALADRSASVRETAAWAIGTIAPSRAPDALLAALRDPESHVRQTAIWALGEIRDPAAVPQLAAFLGEMKSKESYEAVFSLAQIGGDTVRPHLTSVVQHVSRPSELHDAAAAALAGEHFPNRPRPRPLNLKR